MTKPIHRRDGSGHLDPEYAKRLREYSERSEHGHDQHDGRAFIPDPQGGPATARDPLAEALAEEFLESATSGEDVREDALNAVVEEESGGPFVTSSAREEFADDVDSMNPEDAEREPFPRTQSDS